MFSQSQPATQLTGCSPSNLCPNKVIDWQQDGGTQECSSTTATTALCLMECELNLTHHHHLTVFCKNIICRYLKMFLAQHNVLLMAEHQSCDHKTPVCLSFFCITSLISACFMTMTGRYFLLFLRYFMWLIHCYNILHQR